MLLPPAIPSDAARVAVLRSMQILDTQPEPLIDDLARIAATVMGVPTGLVSLVDQDRVWFKARIGMEVTEVPRSHSLCAWAITQPHTPLMVPDATVDPRFADIPLVKGQTPQRFYGGIPLVSRPEGMPIGTLCVMAPERREPTAAQWQALQAIARQVEDRLAQHRREKSGDAESLRAAEVGLRAAMEGTDAGLWEWHVPTNRVLLSPRCRNLLGLPDGDADAYRLWTAGVHPDDLAGVRDALKDLGRPGHDSFRAEYRFMRPDGREMWLLDRGGVTTRDGTGGAVQVVGILVDVTSAHKTAAALAESEHRFRLLADQAPVLIWIGDPDGQCTFVNATWLSYTGRLLDDELGEGWTAGIHPEDLPSCLATYREAHLTRQAFQMEFRLLRSDGAYRYLIHTGAPRLSAQGEFIGFMGSCIDIEDLQVARRRQQESEQRLQEAQAVARLGHWRLDLTTGMVEWSPEVYRIYDFDPLLGSPGFPELVSRVHPDDMEDWQSYIDELRMTGGPAEIEHRIILTDGTVRTVNGRGSATFNGDGIAVTMNGTVQDISERAVLAEETERLISIIERVPDFIHVATVEGAVIYANEALRNRCLADGGVINGLGSMADYQPPDAALTMGTEILPEVDHLGRWTGVTEWRDQHGEVFSTLQTILAHRDRGGVLTHYSSIARDITDQLRNEAELRAAKDQAEAAARAKSGFLAIMSHELRTPLNGALGMLSLLARTPLSAEQRDHMETARTCSQALLSLINDILDFSKLDAGRMELESVPFNPRDIAREALAMVAARAEAAGLHVLTEVASDLPDRFLGDPTRIRQVLINLLSNAVKFTTVGGVTIRIGRVPSGLCFQVRDTGIGMDEAGQARLFRPFSQADSTMTRRFGGTGLGLVICHQLVELMEGQISVESQLGQGSTFRVVLPIESVAEPVLPATLILVDGIAPRRALFARRLKALGITVIQAGSFANLPPGPVLADVHEDTLDPLVDLRATGRQVAVLIETGETAPPGFMAVQRDLDDARLRTALLGL